MRSSQYKREDRVTDVRNLKIAPQPTEQVAVVEKKVSKREQKLAQRLEPVLRKGSGWCRNTILRQVVPLLHIIFDNAEGKPRPVVAMLRKTIH